MEYTYETWLQRAQEARREGKHVMAAVLCPRCHYRLRSGPHDRGFRGVQDCTCEPEEFASRAEILAAHGFEENEDPSARWRDGVVRGD